MRRIALPALLLSCSPLAWAAEPGALDMLIYPNTGIFEVVDGRITGAGEVMMARLQAASGVQFRQQITPIPRALLLAEQKPGTCTIALPRTPEREAHYRWAGPWASSAISLYGRPNETRRIDGPESMRGTQIAALRESNPAAWLKEHGLSCHEVNDATIGLRMLHAGRIDFWLGNDMAARFAMKTMAEPTPRLLYSFGRIDLHIACHPETSAVIMGRLQSGLEQLRRNGDLVEFGLR